MKSSVLFMNSTGIVPIMAMWMTAGRVWCHASTGDTEQDKEGALKMTDERHDTTAQRGAAEVDVAFEKLVSDLHASRENPVEPKELLKRRKRAQRRRRGGTRTSS